MPLSDLMQHTLSITSIVLILIGLFFLLVAAIGVIRFPDVYTRSHAVSLTDSLGAFFVLAGSALSVGISLTFVKILAVLVLLYLLNPAIAHLTVRAAHRAGLQPWSREET